MNHYLNVHIQFHPMPRSYCEGCGKFTGVLPVQCKKLHSPCQGEPQQVQLVLPHLPTLNGQMYLMSLGKKEKTWNMKLQNRHLGGITGCNTNCSSPKAHFLCLLSGPCDNAAYTFPLNLKLEQDSKSSKWTAEGKNTAVTSFLPCFQFCQGCGCGCVFSSNTQRTVMQLYVHHKGLYSFPYRAKEWKKTIWRVCDLLKLCY